MKKIAAAKGLPCPKPAVKAKKALEELEEGTVEIAVDSSCNPAMIQKRSREETVIHTFPPVFDKNSKILILGTIPSPKSREQGFYYGHPRNRFWPVLADILDEQVPVSVEEKRSMALRRHIAVWDVLSGCDICGADDSTIKSPAANDINKILCRTDIKAIFTTGSKAYELYGKYCFPVTGIPSMRLPSTSPANCRISYEELRKSYYQILKYL